LAIARIRTEGAKWAEAIEALKQLIHAGRKPSLLPGAHYALANLYCEPANPAKDFSQARWHFAHVTQTYPKTNLAIASRLGVGQCFLAQGNPNEAVATAEAVLREYPNSSWSAAARALLATSYATLGDWNRASQEYQVVFDPSNVINVTRSQQAAPAFWNSNTMQNGANFLQPPSAALRVTADSMQYSTSHNKVIYTGNVRITRGALTVTADRGEAAVQRRVVTCQGTVRLTDQRGAVITGDALEINFTDGRATMRGDAKAVTTVAGRTRTETAREIVFSPDTGTYRLVP
jgi:TolA-binding protein